MAGDQRHQPVAGPGSGPEVPVTVTDVVFRRATADNAGMRHDEQPAITARFRAENGVASACGASLSARCFNGSRGCAVHR